MDKKLTKGNDIQVAGVCSGIAEYFDIDVSLVRVICILLCLFCSPAILVYVILALTLLDDEDDDFEEDYDDEDMTGDKYPKIDVEVENSFEKTRHKKSNNPFEM